MNTTRLCKPSGKRHVIGLMIALGAIAFILLPSEQPGQLGAALGLFGALVAIWQYNDRKNQNL